MTSRHSILLVVSLAHIVTLLQSTTAYEVVDNSVVCDEGWVKHGNIRCYTHIENLQLNFTDAEAHCKAIVNASENSRWSGLPWIINESALDMITTTFNTSTSPWIGLNDMETECGTQNDTCWPNGYRYTLPYKWCDGQPTAGPGDDCVYIDTDCYRTSACDINRTFICYEEAGVDSCGIVWLPNQDVSIQCSPPFYGHIKSRPTCFHSGETVRLQGGKIVLVKNLIPGDKVMAVNNEGNIIYDQVYSIAHKELSHISWFTEIWIEPMEKKKGRVPTRNVKTLRISPDHLVLTGSGMKAAGDVSRGEVMYIMDESSSVDGGVQHQVIESGQVIRVGTTRLQGVMNVFTKSGYLLVSDVLCAVYVSMPPSPSPLTAATSSHLALYPARVALTNILPSQLTARIASTEDKNGMPLWINVYNRIRLILFAQ